MKNVLAIIDIIFDKRTVAEKLGDSAPAAPPAKKPKTARKDRLTASLPGVYRSLEVEPGIDPSSTDHLSLDSLLDSETADRPKCKNARLSSDTVWKSG